MRFTRKLEDPNGASSSLCMFIKIKCFFLNNQGMNTYIQHLSVFTFTCCVICKNQHVWKTWIYDNHRTQADRCMFTHIYILIFVFCSEKRKKYNWPGILLAYLALSLQGRECAETLQLTTLWPAWTLKLSNAIGLEKATVKQRLLHLNIFFFAKYLWGEVTASYIHTSWQL